MASSEQELAHMTELLDKHKLFTAWEGKIKDGRAASKS